jgi:hypothetical protein
VIEVVSHLNDAELVHGYRTRMSAERSRRSPGTTRRWALASGYASADLPTTLAMLTAMRAANLRLWSAFTPAQLARVGHHSERGPESVGLYLRLAAGHTGAPATDRADPGKVYEEPQLVRWNRNCVTEPDCVKRNGDA